MTDSSNKFAAITPRGRGGIMVLALRGPGAAAFLGRHLRGLRAGESAGESAGMEVVCRAREGRLPMARIVDENQHLVDDAVLDAVGSDYFELACHGSEAVLRRMRALFFSAGFQQAPPGDMVHGAGFPHAERALAAARQARSPLALRLLLRDAFARSGEPWPARVVRERGPEAALGEFRLALRLGRFLAAPPAVAVIGRPNAGKSSLVNALAEAERVVVSPVAGTTRDPVSMWASVLSLPVRLVDTAGTADTAEENKTPGAPESVDSKAGRRAEQATRDAALRLVVLDGAGRDGHSAAMADVFRPAVFVASKADLPGFRAPNGWVPVSAQRGAGLERLRRAMAGALLGEELARRLAENPADPTPGLFFDHAEFAEARSLAEGFAGNGAHSGLFAPPGRTSSP